MIQSPGGVLVRNETTLWQGNTSEFQGLGSIRVSGYAATYAEIYTRHNWVNTVVNKLAAGEARLPLKVYEHDDLNRPDASRSPYGRLLAKPNSRMPRFFFWQWVISTYDIYGESMLLKIRDRGGRPVELAPLHPTCMHLDPDGTWRYENGKVRIAGIGQHDLVHFKTYNPATTSRGLSRLEPLRRSLEFEDAAQRAQSGFWRNGARPGVALKHKGNLSQPAADRLKVQWDNIAGGADNTGKTVVLEEGMEPEVMSLTAEEAQYLGCRKLHQEEVCGEFDMPPPAVHILDRATFSNITEQMRSLYRDTHAPRLNYFEDVLEADLRASVRPGANGPDFGDDVYAEFLLDEVLRGDFEARAQAYKDADYMTMAEKRRSENLPFIEGTDRVFVNAATVPLDAAAYTSASTLVRAGYDPVQVLEALGLPPMDHNPANTMAAPATVAPAAALRNVMGRLSRTTSLADLDPTSLTEGLDPDLASTVTAALALSADAGHTVPEFRERLKALTGGTA